MQPRTNPVSNLTILWAFNECALGGLMHAFKIPFTGIFVGGFAVILIGLIAHFSERNFKVIIRSAFLVLAVKFMVSPQSPAGAYVAVFFQGVFGALVYTLISNFKIASILFAVVAMVESAVQKLLTLTILFGKSLWMALDALLKDIALTFGSDATHGSLSLASVYVAIYVTWGFILGIYLSDLPQKLFKNDHPELIRRLSVLISYYVKSDDQFPASRKHKAYFGYAFIIVLSILIVLLLRSKMDLSVILLRTLAGILILFFFISPGLKLLLTWLTKRQNLHSQTAIQNIMEQLPYMSHVTKACWQHAKENFKGITRLKQFAFLLILITLHGTTDE